VSVRSNFRRLATRVATRVARSVGLVGAAALIVACEGVAVTPAITPGTPANPRDVVILAKDYTFVPPVLDLVPGETVVLQVVNGGLAAHEAVVGPAEAQDAWERAEAPTASAPPGPTPEISIDPAGTTVGVRVFVGSGQRLDATWQVPGDAGRKAWFVGCHIPGHIAAGMIVPVRFIGPDGAPLASVSGSGPVIP
jgi:uncharacterized cupredoxin-like copper-binding protein